MESELAQTMVALTLDWVQKRRFSWFEFQPSTGMDKARSILQAPAKLLIEAVSSQFTHNKPDQL
jgi:hypothetical protein